MCDMVYFSTTLAEIRRLEEEIRAAAQADKKGLAERIGEIFEAWKDSLRRRVKNGN